jgi:hypothetical protein
MEEAVTGVGGGRINACGEGLRVVLDKYGAWGC